MYVETGDLSPLGINNVGEFEVVDGVGDEDGEAYWLKKLALLYSSK